jgi:hypothetical protein
VAPRYQWSMRQACRGNGRNDSVTAGSRQGGVASLTTDTSHKASALQSGQTHTSTYSYLVQCHRICRIFPAMDPSKVVSTLNLSEIHMKRIELCYPISSFSKPSGAVSNLLN